MTDRWPPLHVLARCVECCEGDCGRHGVTGCMVVSVRRPVHEIVMRSYGTCNSYTFVSTQSAAGQALRRTSCSVKFPSVSSSVKLSSMHCMLSVGVVTQLRYETTSGGCTAAVRSRGPQQRPVQDPPPRSHHMQVLTYRPQKVLTSNCRALTHARRRINRARQPFSVCASASEPSEAYRNTVKNLTRLFCKLHGSVVMIP